MKRIKVIPILSIVVIMFISGCGAGSNSGGQSTSATVSSEKDNSKESAMLENSSESDEAKSNVISVADKEDAQNVIETTNETKDVEAPIILDAGWIMSNGFVEYAFEIKNPNEDVGIEFPSIKMTARDESGAILASEEQVLFFIAPGDTLAFGGQMDCNDQTPSEIEFVGQTPEDYNLVTNIEGHFKSTDFDIFNASVQGDKITGEITNNTDNSLSSGCITALFKDSEGKIVAGFSEFINSLNSGETTSFEINMMASSEAIPEYAQIIVTAQEW